MTAVSLVISDLDNTMYDWVGSFVPALYAMVCVAAEIVGVSEDRLLDELRAVHQAHGNSEHPFALLETPSVQAAFPSREPRERREVLEPAFHAFNKTRKNVLRLYDGVRETLGALNAQGVPVVAYTDARVQNALFRLARLELTGLVARLYAPAHVSELVSYRDAPDYVRSIPPGYVYELPAEDRKPNPQTLLDICSSFALAPGEALYVGDSLTRDVYMADQAGLRSAWAKYGVSHDHELWNKLVRVTHWTPDDVSRDQALRMQAAGVQPDVELGSFAELLGAFTYVPAAASIRTGLAGRQT